MERLTPPTKEALQKQYEAIAKRLQQHYDRGVELKATLEQALHDKEIEKVRRTINDIKS